MRRKRSLLFFIILLCFASYGHAQLWSGIIASNRAADWSGAGVEGGIPSAGWTQCGSTINAYTGAGTTIQNAINACSANHYVQLGTGTFTLSSGFSLKSGVVVRGMGANQTFLMINGATGGNACGYSGMMSPSIALCASSSTPQSTTTWTAGYSQGTSQITLGTSGIATGTVLLLDQLDDTDNWPAVGYSFSCFYTGNCSNQGIGAPAGTYRDGRGGGNQLVRITGSSGNVYNITPAISLSNIRSGQSPGALYATNPSYIITYAGVENLSLDYSGNTSGSDKVGIGIVNAANCWITGTRIIYSAGVTNSNIRILNGLFLTVRNNYIYNNYYQQVESYPIYTAGVGSTVIENNICQGPSCDHISDGTYMNSVLSYNFFPGLHGPGQLYHGGGQAMNLFEGNVTMGWGADVTHGTSQFNTVFRNAMIGRRYGPTEVAVGNSIYALAHQRFLNIVGNVMGDSHYNVYEDNPTGGNSNGDAIYTLGGPGNNSGTQQTADPRVKATMMRWGNWDSVTNATRWVTSEVPSGIADFSNPIPATQTMPASFYLSAKPSWWGSIPWPAIGPDVTGGNIANMAGHANLNPAANCYLNVMHGPTDGSGAVLTFNAATCYGSTSTSPPPAAPTGLSVVVQ